MSKLQTDFRQISSTVIQLSIKTKNAP